MKSNNILEVLKLGEFKHLGIIFGLLLTLRGGQSFLIKTCLMVGAQTVEQVLISSIFFIEEYLIAGDSFFVDGLPVVGLNL